MNEIEEAFEEEAELDFADKVGTEMYEKMYKRLMEDIERKLGEQMKGKREEEMDRKKYRQLISEYIEFKRSHVQHFIYPRYQYGCILGVDRVRGMHSDQNSTTGV